MQIEIKGKPPKDPQARVLAIEAAAKAICQQSGTDPADAIMMLLTAAAHLYAQYSREPFPQNAEGLATALGAAIVSADDFFKLKSVSKAPPPQSKRGEAP